MPGTTGQGTYFSDSATNESEVLRKIHVRHGPDNKAPWILWCEYNGGRTTTQRGSAKAGVNYNTNVFTFDDNEYIIAVIFWGDHVPRGLQFLTNRRLSQKLGVTTDLQPTILYAPAGKVLRGFTGYATSEWIYLLDPLWETPPATFPLSIPSLPAVGRIAGEQFMGVDVTGGVDDIVFSDARIAAIKVKSSLQYVESIELLYGTAPSAGDDIFLLNSDEHIVSLEGRNGDYLDQVCFITSTGRRSRVFGGNGGNPFTLRPESPSMRLVFLQGMRSGNAIVNLRAWFMEYRSLNTYDLSDIVFDYPLPSNHSRLFIELCSKYVFNKSASSQKFTENIHIEEKETFKFRIDQDYMTALEVGRDLNFTVRAPKLTGKLNDLTVKLSPEIIESSNGQSHKAQFTKDSTVEIVVSPKSSCHIVIGYVVAKFNNLPWSGVVSVTEAGDSDPPGKTAVSVTGTLSGGLCSRQLQVIVDEDPLTDKDKASELYTVDDHRIWFGRAN